MFISLLIVDDEEKFVSYLSKRLIKRDLNVHTALNGEEALRAIKEKPLDIVILDVVMPGIDGIETLKRIKNLSPLVEVIMLTGKATVETAVEGMKLGAFHYLMKPVEIEDLLAKVKEAYKRKKEQEERIRGAELKEILPK